MLQKGIKVFLAEDTDSIRLYAKNFLEKWGFEVPLMASSLSEAYEAVPNLPKLGIRIALIDGNLSKGMIGSVEGILLANKIREIDQAIKIIGYATSVIHEFEAMCHAFVFKEPDFMIEVKQVIMGLLEQDNTNSTP